MARTRTKLGDDILFPQLALLLLGEKVLLVGRYVHDAVEAVGGGVGLGGLVVGLGITALRGGFARRSRHLEEADGWDWIGQRDG